MADPYVIPDSEGLLRNKLGLTTIEDLREAEYQYSEVGAAELFAARRNFHISMRGWRTVHKVLFREIYDWAGEYRRSFSQKTTSGVVRDSAILSVSKPRAKKRCRG